jgi:hypothetical protein
VKEISFSYYSKKRKDTQVVDLNKYSVFLGNQHWEYFTNKKEAEKFCAEKSRLFTLLFDEIIHIHTQVYSEFWQFWYESDSNESHLLSSFKFIENLINNTMNRSKSDNSDSYYHITGNMRKIADELTLIIDSIIETRRIKNMHGKNRVLKVYRLNLCEINVKLS